MPRIWGRRAPVAERARHEQIGLLCRQSQRDGEVVNSDLVLTLALIQETAIVVGLGVIGTKRDRLVEVGERLNLVALLPMDDPAAEIGGGVIAVDTQRLVVVGQRQFELAALAVQKAAVGVGLRVIRIEADRFVEIRERRVRIAGIRKHRPAHIVGLWIVRMFLDHLAQRGQIGLGRCDRRFAIRSAYRTQPRAGGQRQQNERRQASYQEMERSTSLRHARPLLLALDRRGADECLSRSEAREADRSGRHLRRQ